MPNGPQVTVPGVPEVTQLTASEGDLVTLLLGGLA